MVRPRQLAVLCVFGMGLLAQQCAYAGHSGRGTGQGPPLATTFGVQLLSTCAGDVIRIRGLGELANAQCSARSHMGLRGGSDLVRTRFEVQAEGHVQPGDAVAIVWENAPAGRVRPVPYQPWDRPEAVDLVTSDDQFPRFWAQLALPVGDTVEFRFAVRSVSGGALAALQAPASPAGW